jgi:hypothetical protein
MNHHKTIKFFNDINKNKYLSELERDSIFIKYAIQNNAFDAINIRFLMNNKNKSYNVIELLHYDFGNGNNFLHFLIKEYNSTDFDIFIFLIELLNINGLLSTFFKDDNTNEILTPINLGFKYNKFNNIYILLLYIKNKTIHKRNFYNTRLLFDIDCFKLVSYLIKYEYDNVIIDDCKKNIYNKGKLWNSYFFPFPIS